MTNRSENETMDRRYAPLISPAKAMVVPFKRARLSTEPLDLQGFSSPHQARKTIAQESSKEDPLHNRASHNNKAWLRTS
jgi:hypothetical protein